MSRMYRGKNADDRAREQRERLIAAGFTEFTKRGLANTSIAGLCKRARISVRVFYTMFHTKDDLLAVVVNRRVDDAVTAVVNRLELADQEVCTLVEAAVRAYMNYVMSDRRIYRLLHEESYHLRRGYERGNPLPMILTETLKGRVDWPEPDVRLMATAMAGVVPALLGVWHRDEGVTPQQVVETAARVCAVILSSAEVFPCVRARGQRLGSDSGPF